MSSDRYSFDEQLILEVQNNQILYDKQLPEYKNRNSVNNAWTEIAAIMEAPLELVEKRWKNLKDVYRTKCRENSLIPTGSAGVTKKQWMYYTKMSFLMPYIKVDETESNYSISSDENSGPSASNEDETDENREFTTSDAKRRRVEMRDRKHVTNKILKALDNLDKDETSVQTRTTQASAIKLFFDSLAAKAECLDEYQQSVLEMTCLEAYQKIKFHNFADQTEYLDE